MNKITLLVNNLKKIDENEILLEIKKLESEINNIYNETSILHSKKSHLEQTLKIINWKKVIGKCYARVDNLTGEAILSNATVLNKKYKTWYRKIQGMVTVPNRFFKNEINELLVIVDIIINQENEKEIEIKTHYSHASIEVLLDLFKEIPLNDFVIIINQVMNNIIMDWN